MSRRGPLLTCPAGHEFRIPPITYGYPLPETFEAADRGEVTIGGCIPDLPVERSCPTCRLIAYSESVRRPDRRPGRSTTDTAKP